MADFEAEFKAQIRHYWAESLRHLELALQQVDDGQIWQRPNPGSNSIGNLILHLCGNIRQYAISSLGRKPDARDRDGEFAATDGLTKAELWAKITSTIEEASEILAACPTDELTRTRTVQGFQMTGIAVFIHVTEHFSYHVGQIAFWVKCLNSGQDLGFYAGFQLNQTGTSIEP